MKHKIITRLFTFFFFISCFILSQEKHYYQTDFLEETFNTRRAKVFKEIGNKTIALSTERYRTCNEEERADSISPGKVVAP